MNIHFWNIFHDGEISAINGAVPGDIDFTIEIEFLREEFADPGKGFILHIVGCTMISFTSFRTNQTVHGPGALQGEDLEILSSEIVGNDLVVTTSGGQLRLRYESETISLDTGRPLQLSDVAAASEKALSDYRKSNP